MPARPMRQSELSQVQALARELWPYDPHHAFKDEYVFVWEKDDGTLGGFACVSIRPWVDGTDAAPCPHVEGWFVEAAMRQGGVGRALILAIENWCRQHGFRTLTSDTTLDNEVSLRAHEALGFETTEQLQYFKKAL